MTQPDPNQPAGQAPAGQAQQAPPWGTPEQFDPAKAWNLIQNLRGDLEKAKARPVLTDEMRTQLDEYARISDAAKTDLEKANEQLSRWQTEAETWRNAAVGSKIQALAANDFADPDDALRTLNPADYLGAGGDIDETRIKTDLSRLLDAKPHYRKPEPSGPRSPAPNNAQGSSGGTSSPDPAAEFGAILHQAMSR